MEPINTTCIYARLSREDKEQAGNGDQLASQIDRAVKYCTLRDLIPLPAFSDLDVSGGVPIGDRPGGRELLKTIKSGVKNVVVCKYDRLWRDVDDARAVMREWNKRGIALHIVDMGGQAVNTSTATGWIMFNMLLVFSEGERLIIGERTKQKLDYKKANGHKLGGHTPFGFTAIDKGRRSKNQDGTERILYDLEPNPTEQTIIAQMVQLRETHTLQEIANELMQQAVPTKRGGLNWTPGNVAAVLERHNKLTKEKAA